jgi:hypothetical protein
MEQNRPVNPHRSARALGLRAHGVVASILSQIGSF